MANLATRERERSTVVVIAAVPPGVNLLTKLYDKNFTPFKKAVPLKLSAPMFPKASPLLSGPMPNAPGPALGGLISALIPLAILAMLATALSKMVGKILNPNKQPALQPVH